MFIAIIEFYSDRSVTVGPTDTRDEASRLARAVMEGIAAENATRRPGDSARQVYGVRIERIERTEEDEE